MQQFLDHISLNYTLDKYVFFLHPESSMALEQIFVDRGWYYCKFDTGNPEIWRYSETDSNHWSCEGFKQATAQIIQYLTIQKIVR